jgi:hypothetical protein
VLISSVYQQITSLGIDIPTKGSPGAFTERISTT